MVKRSGSDGDDLSNAWPTDLLEQGLCDPDIYCIASANSAGNGAFISPGGTSSLSTADLSFDCYGLPSNQYGIFYYGAASTETPFGHGYRCVSAGGMGLFRIPPAQQMDTFGDVGIASFLDQSPSNSGLGAITPGSTWYFQFWYRDPGMGAPGFNLSSALSIVFEP